MTSKEIKQYASRIGAFIDRRRLNQAISELRDTSRRASAWQVLDKLDQAEQAYAFMLQYVAQGTADPQRAEVYNSIVNNLYSALDQLVFELELPDTSSQYYSMVRLARKEAQAPDRIASMLADYKAQAADSSLFSMVAGQASGTGNAAKLEHLQADIFNAVWTTPLLSQTEADALESALASDELSSEFKQHLISAIMLGQLHRADSRKAELLMAAYMAPNADVKVTSAALVGLLISLWRYANRPLPQRLAARLAAIKEMPSWPSDLKIAFIELIRARDTERINKKIRDEVIPGMMNLRPEIMNKINDGKIDPSDMASLQENPEWQELLDKNGITDKLKELNDMQMEGADVMMSTFANLKQFPFFYETSNWFLPFSASHSSVAKVAQEMPEIADIMERSTVFCDGDKYSFLLSINAARPLERQFMTSQFKAQIDAFYQAMEDAASDTQPEARKKAVNSYIQNIYRFFKLYLRKNEFFDPFDKGVNLLAVPPLASDFADADLLEVVAEFYFRHGYWTDALSAFSRLDAMAEPLAARHQKMGFALERLGKHAEAIDHYLKAELLDSSSQWTLRRLAVAYRAIGNNDKALHYYSRLAELNPESTSVALQLGYVLLEKGDYALALKQFFKAEFLDEKSTKAFRPLAWTLFLNGDFDGAQRYYDKVMADNPTANDRLNMGHTALARGMHQLAIDHYAASAKMRTGGVDEFVQAFDDDAPALIAAGVDPELLPLIADAAALATKK